MKNPTRSQLISILITTFFLGSISFHIWRLNYLKEMNTSLNSVCASISPYLQIGSTRWARELAEGSLKVSFPKLAVSFETGATQPIATVECKTLGRTDQPFRITLENGEFFESQMLRTFGISLLFSFFAVGGIALIFRVMSNQLALQIGQAWTDRLEISNRRKNERPRKWTARLLDLIPGIDRPREAVLELNSKLEAEIERATNLQVALINRRTFSKYVHDIRSPIGALQIVLQKNRSKFLPDENSLLDQVLVRLKEIPDAVLQVEKSASKAILNEILVTDLQEVLQITFDRLNTEFGKACEIHLSLSHTDSEIENRSLPLSASDLDRLITNLIVNSQQAGSTNVKVDIKVSPERAIFAINDNGKGGLDLLSSPKNAQGFGLGIEIVSEILERAGAQMKVDSPLGKGTQVSMNFLTKAAAQ